MPSSLLDQYAPLIDNSPVAMALYDTDMRIVHLNAEFAQLARLDLDATRGKVLYDVAPATRARSPIHEILLTGESRIDKNVPHQFPDEERPRYSDIRYKPVRDHNGAVIGILTTVTDVTEQVHASQELHEMLSLRENFLDLSAHELRTPITVIKAFAQLAQRPEFRDRLPWLQYAIEVMGRHSDHMAQLIQDMLEVSRIGKGQLSLYREKFDLGELMGGLEREYEPLFESCRSTFELPAEPVLVEADRNRIGTVFANIVDNAAKYTREKTQCAIKLALEVKEKEVIASVQDNGIGIPADQQSKVFERFFRASNVNTRSRNGLGLGLYICKSIIELHKGRIWLESAANHGTTVYFSLPVLTA